MSHIKEGKNEELDYEAFYHTPGPSYPTGRTSTTDAGRSTWRMWQGMADHYPCGGCKGVAQNIAYGSETMVGLLIGKDNAPKYPEQFERLHAIMEKAWAVYTSKCKGGNCKRQS